MFGCSCDCLFNMFSWLRIGENSGKFIMVEKVN